MAQTPAHLCPVTNRPNRGSSVQASPRRFKSLGEHSEQLHTQSETRDLNPRKNDNPCQLQGRPPPGTLTCLCFQSPLSQRPAFQRRAKRPQGVRGTLRLAPRPSTTRPGPDLQVPCPGPWASRPQGTLQDSARSWGGHHRISTPGVRPVPGPRPSPRPPKTWDFTSVIALVGPPPKPGLRHRGAPNPGTAARGAPRVPPRGQGFNSTRARLDPEARPQHARGPRPARSSPAPEPLPAPSSASPSSASNAVAMSPPSPPPTAARSAIKTGRRAGRALAGRRRGGGATWEPGARPALPAHARRRTYARTHAPTPAARATEAGTAASRESRTPRPAAWGRGCAARKGEGPAFFKKVLSGNLSCTRKSG